MFPRTDPRTEMCGGTSAAYRGRVCGMPVDTRFRERPADPLMCPECAIAYVTAVFPAAPDLRHEVRLRA